MEQLQQWTKVLLWCCVVASTVVSNPDSIRYELHRFEVDPTRSREWKRDLTVKSDGLDGNYALVPLNIGTGTHYTWVYAGTPPQRASVIVDTGSHIMAFPCSGCASCGTHTDAPYDMTKSSTSSFVSCKSHPQYSCSVCHTNDQCIVRQSYTEGSSWTAVLVEDIVFLGNETNTPSAHLEERFGVRMKFGCQTSETGLFRTQKADGIIGMAAYEITLVPHLYSSKKIQHKLFSLCFSETGGSMVLGAPETFKHTSDVSYARMQVSRSHWYSLFVTDIRIDGRSIGAPASVYQKGKQIIVDSGTTDSYLPSAIENQFMDTYSEVSGFKYATAYTGECQGPTAEQMTKLPAIQFVMEDTDGNEMVVEFPASQYMERNSNGKYCSSVYLSESSGGVLGANLMMNHDVIFDAENNRIGFAKADCEFPKAADQPQQTEKTSAATEQPKTEDASATQEPKTPVSTSTEQPKTSVPTSTEHAKTETPAPTQQSETETTDTQEPKTEQPKAETPAPTEQPKTETPAPTEQPKTETPAPTEQPKTETPAPTEQPKTEDASAATEQPKTEDASAPTEQPNTETRAPTPASTEQPKAETPATEEPKPDAATPEKKPSTKDHVNGPSSQNQQVNGAPPSDPPEHPVVLTIVGVIVSALFLGGALAKCNSKRKKSHWMRVEAHEEDEDGRGLVNMVAEDQDIERQQQHRLPYRDEPNVCDQGLRQANNDKDDDNDNDDDDDFFESSDRDSGAHDEAELDRL